MADISKNIRRLRTAQSMSQAALADKVGVTRQTISSWERGSSFPDLAMLEKLASVFGTGLDGLLYPGSSGRKKRVGATPLSPSFILWSVVLFSILFILGGGIVGIPLFKATLGGNVRDEPFFLLCWGLILLVGYLAICVCLLSECIAEASADAGPDSPEDERQSG